LLWIAHAFADGKIAISSTADFKKKRFMLWLRGNLRRRGALNFHAM